MNHMIDMGFGQTLRSLPLLLALAAGSLLPSNPAMANNADRQVLRDRLEFHYVANGNTTPRPAAEILNNSQIHGGTESGNFWSNASVAGLQGIVRALLRDNSNGGNDMLQYYVRRVVEINPGARKIKVVLFDDVSQTLNRSQTRSNWGGCIKSNGRAWPCATHYPSGTFGGAMWLGAHYFRTASTSKMGTFLHETMHTQDRTDGRAHLFTVGGRSYRYGSDQSHYGVELVPNRAMTYKEGIANALRLRYDNRSEQRYFELFASNDFLWVERGGPPAGSGVSADAWLHSQLTAAGVSPDTVPADLRARLTPNLVNNYDAYRFHRLPPRFVLHNEYVLAMIMDKYMDHVDPSRFFSGLSQVNDALFRVSGSGIAVLFEALCNAGLPTGSSLAEVSGSSVTSEHGYVLPLAYADYFTGFRSANKAEFASLFENLLPDGWINLYWDTHRTTARGAVTAPSAAHRAQRSELTDIAIALGLRQSRQD